MLKTTKYLLVATGLAVAFVLQSGFTAAQDVPQLEEYQKSVALIDMRVDQLIKEAVALGIEKVTIDEMELEGPFKDVKPSEIERVFGAICLPENIDKAMAMTTGPPKDGMPLDFFIRIKFTGEEPLERVRAALAEGSEMMTLDDGKEYMTPPGIEKGLFFAHRVDKTTFEVGTKGYLLQAKRNFFTAQLKTAFAAAPKESVRIVIDLESRREFLQQAAEMAKQGLDPISSAYVDLIGNAKSLAVTASLGSENLLSAIVEANNDSDAEELAEGIDGLLGIAKVGFAAMNAQMAPLLTPEMEAPLNKIVEIFNSLAATQSGTAVKVLVKKPENFAQEVAKLQKGLAAQREQFFQLQNELGTAEDFGKEMGSEPSLE